MHGVLTIPDLMDTWAREMSLNVIGSESRSVTIDLRRGGSALASSSSIPPQTTSSVISTSSVLLSVENENDENDGNAGEKAGWYCRSRRPNLDVDSI